VTEHGRDTRETESERRKRRKREREREREGELGPTSESMENWAQCGHCGPSECCNFVMGRVIRKM
jgi:hypothetical protein